MLQTHLGAADGNRTHDICLEGRGVTSTLLLHREERRAISPNLTTTVGLEPTTIEVMLPHVLPT